MHELIIGQVEKHANRAFIYTLEELQASYRTGMNWLGLVETEISLDELKRVHFLLRQLSDQIIIKIQKNKRR